MSDLGVSGSSSEGGTVAVEAAAVEAGGGAGTVGLGWQKQS